METLNLNGQSLNPESFEEMITPIKNTLKELNISKCSLGRESEGRDIVFNIVKQLNGLRKLDISENYITVFPENFSLPQNLETLLIKGNKLTEIPDFVFQATSLKVLYLSGNEISSISEKISSLTNLEELYIGGNKIVEVPAVVGQLRKLKVLYLGGNRIEEIPDSIGELNGLKCLYLHENLIRQLPHSMVQLVNLEVLNLHKNEIQTLPVEIIGLRQLKQLSVRENPLLTNFVQSMSVSVPTLLELSARAVKKYQLEYNANQIPSDINRLLSGAKCCVGCGGTYFGNGGVGQVEFVDLCGSYRVPFLKYICSKNCFNPQESSLGQVQQIARLRKVLLDKYSPSNSASVEVLQEEIEQNEMDNDLF